jgi:hypothetical protein
MDEAISDTQHNTCATSYVTSDNSKTYAISYIKSYTNEGIKTDLSKNDVYFIPEIKLYIV